MSVVKVNGIGLAKEVTAPVYGRQDIGYSPGGPMDRFSMQIGNLALGNDGLAPALEIIAVGSIEFQQDCLFLLTGAKRQEARLLENRSSGQTVVDLAHGSIALARQGDCLTLGPPEYGFRTYLCHTRCDAQDLTDRQRSLLGRTIPKYSEVCTVGDPENRIRVLRGPEWEFLENPTRFLDPPWMTTTDMSDMGMRLRALAGAPLGAKRTDIISAPVNDGTIQLTAKGPIVLLRSRQTIGGYPRVFNVIGPDVDLLGQYAPNQAIRFTEVSVDEALDIASRKNRDLEVFQRRWASGAPVG